jgi:glyoxylase-like metal-dependent hydrolase (beta-lactamase superfamily II)
VILETLSLGPLQTNCYIVAAGPEQQAAVIDPGDEVERVQDTLLKHALTVKFILLTHYHFDHTGAVLVLRQATGAEVCIHEREAASLADPPVIFRLFAPGGAEPITADRQLGDNEVLDLGELSLTCLPTPGHSPGGLSFYSPSAGVVFSGDALFAGGIGRTDFPGSSFQTLAQAIRERLYTLPPETVVYPGHGPHTTIGAERRSNPFVRPQGRA